MNFVDVLLKSLFDHIVAFLGLLFLSPILLVTAILIRVKMPGGPVIFRSMTVGHSGSSVSVKGESRITPLGAKLRKYKIDELPELWNVLIGDMSLVGPRPDVPGYADNLQGGDRRMLLLKPGITGPASLKYRNEEELLAGQDNPQKYNDEVLFPDKVRINIEYLDNWSFWNDIKIIVYTVFGKDM